MANDIGPTARQRRLPVTSRTRRAAGARHAIAILAAAAMLVHGALLARHNVVMLEAESEHRSLLADLASLCRAASADARHVAPTELPSLPRPSDGAGCLVCAGLLATFGILEAQPTAMSIDCGPATVSPGATRSVLRTASTAHPPARGPPAQG